MKHIKRNAMLCVSVLLFLLLICYGVFFTSKTATLSSAKENISSNTLAATGTADFSLNPNGGSLYSTDATYSDLTGRTTTWTTSYLSLPGDFNLSDVSAVRSGYMFTGWGKSSSCTSGSTSTVTFSSDTTYYACWTTGTADFSLNPNGGSLYSTDATYSDLTGRTTKWTTSYLTLPGDFDLSAVSAIRSGYTFNGWGKSSSCTSGSTSTVTFSSDTTYYACWTTDTVVSTQTEEDISQVYGYRYVINSSASYQGNTVNCGDYVYVTTCDNSRLDSSTCNITSINHITVSATKVYRQQLATEAPTSCGTITRYAGTDTSYYTSVSGTTLKGTKKTLACGETVTFTDSVVNSCSYGSTLSTSDSTNTAHQYCKVNYNGSTIYVDRKTLTSVEPTTCSDSDEETCEGTSKQTNIIGSTTTKLCYEYKDGDLTRTSDYSLTKAVTCASGYTSSSSYLIDDTCSDLADSTSAQTCHKTYLVNCTSSAKPSVSATGSLVNNYDYGTVTFKATDNGTSGIKGYYISSGSAPTVNSTWTGFDNTNYSATVKEDPGTYFIWVMSNTDVISYSVLAKVYDSDLTTSLSQVQITDANGNVTYNPTPLDSDSTTGYVEGVVDSNYVRLSNTLKQDTVLAGFTQLTTAYEVTVTSAQIAVYATLTSNDASYVEGYEPRTVDLDYGRNVILIKIVNNSGKTRTYTFIVNRTDDRASDNILSDLTVSAGSLDFDSYTSDYTISVPTNTDSVTINGTLNSDSASFVAGYEPRKVSLDNDVTSAVVKTISQAGVTRSYVLTFVKTGADTTENMSNSTYLSSLTVQGTQLDFDRSDLNYSVSVPYEVEDVAIYAFAESENATVTVEGNQNLKVGPNNVNITVTNGSKSKVYTVTINRKEDGLGVSSDTTLGTLTVKNYDINFQADVLDYVVKIKREKTLLITATPNSNRSQVYMYGNNDLTAFSTIRVKVIAENGDTGIYSIDIQKAAYNKTLEITIAIVGGVVVISAAVILIVHKKRKKLKEYKEN